MSNLDPFLEGVSRRLSRYRFVNGALRCVFFVSLVTLVIGISFLIRGLEIPKALYLTGALAAGILSLLGYVKNTTSGRHASRFADSYYDLKDALSSNRSFARSGREGAFYELQQRQTEEALRVANLDQMTLPFPGKWVVLVCGALLAIVIAGFVPPASWMVAKRAQEAEVSKKSGDLRERLEDVVHRLEGEITDQEEHRLLEEAKLLPLFKELKATTDLKEAMRQYAALERRVAHSASMLDQRRDEQLLARAGEELSKELEHRQLAEKLLTRNYRDAAKRWQELQVKGAAEPGQDQLPEQRARLRKLRSATQRMAFAAKSSRDRLSSRGQTRQELAEVLERLDELAQNLGLTLDKAGLLREGDEGGAMARDARKELPVVMEMLDQQLNQLGVKMREMDAKRRLQGKLRLLGMQLSKAQGYLAGNLNSPFASPGGENPGEGTSEERREQREPLVDNGQDTEIKGIKGAGPGQTRVTEAREGLAVSGRQAAEVERSFAKQLEAFVEREDVPEELKAGVREYFTTIHQPDDESAKIVEP